MALPSPGNRDNLKPTMVSAVGNHRSPTHVREQRFRRRSLLRKDGLECLRGLRGLSLGGSHSLKDAVGNSPFPACQARISARAFATAFSKASRASSLTPYSCCRTQREIQAALVHAVPDIVSSECQTGGHLTAQLGEQRDVFLSVHTL